jgi:hypothetical protein
MGDFLEKVPCTLKNFCMAKNCVFRKKRVCPYVCRLGRKGNRLPLRGSSREAGERAILSKSPLVCYPRRIMSSRPTFPQDTGKTRYMQGNFAGVIHILHRVFHKGSENFIHHLTTTLLS